MLRYGAETEAALAIFQIFFAICIVVGLIISLRLAGKRSCVVTLVFDGLLLLDNSILC